MRLCLAVGRGFHAVRKKVLRERVGVVGLKEEKFVRSLAGEDAKRHRLLRNHNTFTNRVRIADAK